LHRTLIDNLRNEDNDCASTNGCRFDREGAKGTEAQP
jgi:hypothetical protein